MKDEKETRAVTDLTTDVEKNKVFFCEKVISTHQTLVIPNENTIDLNVNTFTYRTNLFKQRTNNNCLITPSAYLLHCRFHKGLNIYKITLYLF